jgi:hypothetical protein
MFYERLVPANTGKRKTETNAKEPELFPKESDFPGNISSPKSANCIQLEQFNCFDIPKKPASETETRLE